MPLVLTFLAVALLVASCTSGGTDPATAPVPTATVVSTLPAGALTVGEILARVESAWPLVDSMRTTFWATEESPGGTPAPTGMVTVEEVRLPADRRVVISTDGRVTDEQIAVGGRIYMKGALVQVAIAPLIDTETWVEVDPAAANAGSPVSLHISYLLSPIVSPFSAISGTTSGLHATPGEAVTIAGQTCDVFTFGDPDGISYELALDIADLPCRFVQSAGGVSNVTIYEFNDPALNIVAPELPGVATPIGD